MISVSLITFAELAGGGVEGGATVLGAGWEVSPPPEHAETVPIRKIAAQVTPEIVEFTRFSNTKFIVHRVKRLMNRGPSKDPQLADFRH